MSGKNSKSKVIERPLHIISNLAIKLAIKRAKTRSNSIKKRSLASHFLLTFIAEPSGFLRLDR